MCGILGVSTLNRNTKPIVPFLAWAMQQRGSDSWGASNGVEVVKHMGKIRNSFYLPSNWSRHPVFVHTRAASKGVVCIENAHPHEIGDIIGIHNGTLSNHSELNSKYNRTYDVDTAHIFRHISEGLELDDISGTAVIVWFNKAAPGQMFLCRINHTSLEVVKLKTGEVIFASELTAIKEAVSMGGGEIEAYYTVDPEMVYRLDCKENKLFETDKSYKFKSYTNSKFSSITHIPSGPLHNWHGHIADGRRCDTDTNTRQARLLIDKKKCFVCLGVLPNGSYLCDNCTEKALEEAEVTVDLWQKEKELHPRDTNVPLLLTN